MVFWGVEVKPTIPVTLKPDPSKGRLHISLATLGRSTASNKSSLQCKVGNKSPVLLCSLFPGHTESCLLNLEFYEADEVIFSVLGPRSVFLNGYFLPSGGDHIFPDESDSYGEDIGYSESEGSIRSSEDQYEDSFINDSELEADSLISSYEDKLDEKKTKDNKGRRGKLQKKRRQLIVSDDDDDKSLEKDFSNGHTVMKPIEIESESESEGKFTFSIWKKRAGEKSNGPEAKGKSDKESHDSGKNEIKDNGNCVKTSDIKRGNTENDLTPKKKKEEKPKELEPVKAPALDEEDCKATTDKENTENGTVSKKKKEEKPKEEEPIEGPRLGLDEEVNKVDKKLFEAKVPENNIKTKGKRKIHTEEGGNNETQSGEKKKKKMKKTETKGLVIVDLELGKPDGKIATSGKKVYINYVGKFKENGQVFESNADNSPKKFRLGDESVLKGWNIGIDGMRVGGKRKLVIPPSLGYDGGVVNEKVPPNSTVVFEIELVKVRK